MSDARSALSQLAAIERQMRADIAATGPEDQDAPDRPPVAGSSWGRLTVEEAMIGIRISGSDRAVTAGSSVAINRSRS